MKLQIDLPELDEILAEHQRQHGARSTIKAILIWLGGTPTLIEAQMLKSSLDEFLVVNQSAPPTHQNG